LTLIVESYTIKLVYKSKKHFSQGGGLWNGQMLG
jgi:hypothetical protein